MQRVVCAAMGKLDFPQTSGYVMCLAARVWFNGRTKASQALDEGSIPFTRSKLCVFSMIAGTTDATVR
jgi:hypothetical protein